MKKQTNLTNATFRKATKQLTLGLKFVGPAYPHEIDLYSDYTGNVITFRSIGPDDKMFDEDGWDGVQQVYAPVQHCPRVEYLIVSDFYD